jgi:GABA permease
MSKVLIVANETVGAEELLAEIRRLEDERTSEFLVVVPARPLHEVHGSVWTQEGAQEAARERLDGTLRILHAEGLQATGVVGDALPIPAIGDALMDFDADLIVISTHPAERSSWLRGDIVEKARRKFGKPVVHVVSHVATRSGA